MEVDDRGEYGIEAYINYEKAYAMFCRLTDRPYGETSIVKRSKAVQEKENV